MLHLQASDVYKSLIGQLVMKISVILFRYWSVFSTRGRHSCKGRNPVNLESLDYESDNHLGGLFSRKELIPSMHCLLRIFSAGA